MSLKINKLKREVELTIRGSEPICGTLFLNAVSEVHHGADRVADLLRHAKDFIPFETEAGEFWMVSRASVLRVVVDAKFELAVDRDYGQEPLYGKRVIVKLADGSEERGLLLIDEFVGASRPLDQLNRTQGFIPIQQDDKVVILNLSTVAAVIEEAN